MSQKELATKINEKPQIITDYEAGRGIPNNIIIGKIERVLGIKLRGKDRGKALQLGDKKIKVLQMWKVEELLYLNLDTIVRFQFAFNLKFL